MTLRVYIETMASDVPDHGGLSTKDKAARKILVSGESDTARTLQFIIRRLEAINVYGENPQVNTFHEITGLKEEPRVTVFYDEHQTSEAAVVTIVKQAALDSCIHRSQLNRRS